VIGIIGHVVLNDIECERKIANIIKTDFKLLLKKIDLVFLNTFLIPLMNVEQKIPVCISAFDSITDKQVIFG